MTDRSKSEDRSAQPAEPEFRGPWYKHPYFLYVAITVLIFGFLLSVTWIASSLDLIPNRGIR